MSTRKKALLFMLMLGLVLVVGTTALGYGPEGYVSNMYGTFWSLVPALVAIVFALITKEVYLSLFLGIICGALFYADFNVEIAVTSIFQVMLEWTGDSWNLGILIFLVLLGIIVSLMMRAGGSAAFGRWAQQHIKTRFGAQIITLILGVFLFVDDYFNCLTVGSVMRPVTDSHKISRAKLAYLIDSTAAPICIIAPISSWAAAVSSYTEGFPVDGFTMFIQSIPFNLYALLTIAMVILLSAMNADYGPMLKHELNAMKGDLYTTADRPYALSDENPFREKCRVIDLILPVIALIVCCIACLAYTGGILEGASLRDAFANCDASFGLVLGGFIALVITFLLYIPRRVMTLKQFTSCFPEGFRAMVPAILILVLAWTLSGFVRDALGSGEFVKAVVSGNTAASFFMPAVLFLIASFVAFSTGTSWGTFGILIPIVLSVFTESSNMMLICVAASLAGAVCGDHCSPISDTTIMSSTGAQCNHINHVNTQLPYALTVAAISFVGYLIAGALQTFLPHLPVAWLTLGAGLVLLVLVLLIAKVVTRKRRAQAMAEMEK